MRRGGRNRAKASAGFTFLELVIVLAVIGSLFYIASPNFHGFMPKYRLRSAARNVGTTLEQVRLAAMTRGVWMGIRYELTPTDSERSYFQIIPAAPEDLPDQPIEDRKPLPRDELPDGVRIARIILSNNHVVDRGAINIAFSPLGNAGSHIVVLEEVSQERIFSLKLNCISGAIEFFEGAEASFQHFTE